jgi:hypothetical protein
MTLLKNNNQEYYYPIPILVALSAIIGASIINDIEAWGVTNSIAVAGLITAMITVVSIYLIDTIMEFIGVVLEKTCIKIWKLFSKR